MTPSFYPRTTWHHATYKGLHTSLMLALGLNASITASSVQNTTTATTVASSTSSPTSPSPSSTSPSASTLIDRIIHRCSHPHPHFLTQVFGQQSQATTLVIIWTSLMCPACQSIHHDILPSLIQKASSSPQWCLVIQDNPIYPQSLIGSCMIMECPPEKRALVLKRLFALDLEPEQFTAERIASVILEQWDAQWPISRQQLKEALAKAQEKSHLETCFHAKKKETKRFDLEGAPHILVLTRLNPESAWTLRRLTEPHELLTLP